MTITIPKELSIDKTFRTGLEKLLQKRRLKTCWTSSTTLKVIDMHTIEANDYE